MTIFVIMLAIALDGEVLTFVAGKGGRPQQFHSADACEIERIAVEKWATDTLAANPATREAKVIAVRCVERRVDGV